MMSEWKEGVPEEPERENVQIETEPGENGENMQIPVEASLPPDGAIEPMPPETLEPVMPPEPYQQPQPEYSYYQQPQVQPGYAEYQSAVQQPVFQQPMYPPQPSRTRDISPSSRYSSLCSSTSTRSRYTSRSHPIRRTRAHIQPRPRRKGGCPQGPRCFSL